MAIDRMVVVEFYYYIRYGSVILLTADLIKRLFKASCLALLLVIFSTDLILAVQCSTGPYKIEVNARTSTFQPIPQAFVKCSHSGGKIRVMASAPGFVPQNREINIISGVNSYFVTLKLADREKRFEILTYDYKPIVSSYVDSFQGGTPSHLYAINVMLPVKTWPNPTAENVKVNQPGYGWPIQQSCDINLFEDFYRVRLTIDRAVLDDPKDHLLIYVNTADKTALKQRFNELHRD